MDATPIIIVLLIAIAFVWYDRRKLRLDRHTLHRQREEAEQAREEQRQRAQIRNARLDRETDDAISALSALRSQPTILGAASVAAFDAMYDDDYPSSSHPTEPADDDDLPGYDISAAAGLDPLDQLHGYYGAGQASVNGWFSDSD